MDNVSFKYVRSERDGLRSVEIHLDAKLTDESANATKYFNPYYADGPKLTHIGSELVELLTKIPGLVDLEYVSYSFRFRIADAFDENTAGQDAVCAIFDALDAESLILISDSRTTCPVSRSSLAQVLGTHVFNTR